MSNATPEGLPAEAQRHYAAAREAERLAAGKGELEYLRTQAIVRRWLPPAPAVVLDVGGGPGRYAFWLAGEGYVVHLVDAVPKHVEEAQAKERASGVELASASVQDARALDFADESVDLVLLLGPLYHLTERADRVRALAEARRVLRPGGCVVAAAISRHASALDGLVSGHLDDPDFRAIVERDLAEGQHRNPADHPAWFTTAYFHRPEELAEELAEAGLAHEATLAVEGPAWTLQGFAGHWDDPVRRARLLDVLGRMEAEPSLLGASAHLLAVGRA